jgi:hypothetical protein
MASCVQQPAQSNKRGVPSMFVTLASCGLMAEYASGSAKYCPSMFCQILRSACSWWSTHNDLQSIVLQCLSEFAKCWLMAEYAVRSAEGLGHLLDSASCRSLADYAKDLHEDPNILRICQVHAVDCAQCSLVWRGTGSLNPIPCSPHPTTSERPSTSSIVCYNINLFLSKI